MDEREVRGPAALYLATFLLRPSPVLIGGTRVLIGTWPMIGVIFCRPYPRRVYVQRTGPRRRDALDALAVVGLLEDDHWLN